MYMEEGGVDWWDGTADHGGEDVWFARHGGEGVRSAYARAWYWDVVEVWKDRCEWSDFTEAVDGETGWCSTVWLVVCVGMGRRR